MKEAKENQKSTKRDDDNPHIAAQAQVECEEVYSEENYANL